MVERVQLSRKKGWRMPPNTVIVSRPSYWGNQWEVWRDEDGQWTVSNDSEHTNVDSKTQGIALAVRLHAERERKLLNGYGGASRILELRGKNLACWCKLDQPCHADVLLELANRELLTHD